MIWNHTFPIRRVASVGCLLRHGLRAAVPPEAVRARLRPYRKPHIAKEQGSPIISDASSVCALG